MGALGVSIGDRFGRLTVIAPAAPKHGHRAFTTRCECGKEHVVAGSDLARGAVRSCGCLNQEMRIARNTTHGHAARGRRHVLYQVWCALVRRCTDPKSADWPDYGGRGITVCDRWRTDFAAFLADMGERPSPKHSIDRIKNDRGYEPGNCRWATGSEQALNRRPKRWYRRPAAAQES